MIRSSAYSRSNILRIVRGNGMCLMLTCDPLDHQHSQSQNIQWDKKTEPLGYHNPSVGVWARYRRICFTALWCDSFGVAWKQAHMQTLSIISGLDAHKYNKEPIMKRYTFWSKSIAFSSVHRWPFVGIRILTPLQSCLSNFLSTSLSYFSWDMNMPLRCWRIWRPKKNFNSPIIDIWYSSLII